MTGQTQKLMDWYDANRRILPWREDPTPYHIWLSEIMLQQTRVEAGKEYYRRFLEELPDIASLATAPEDVCMKLWEGLGYYSRIRNMHKAAAIIMDQYNGDMPATVRELQKLPGIGAYTAAAIASIAFGKQVVSVDGNLIRIFSRMTEYAGNAKDPAAKKEAGSFLSPLQPADRPGDFNQALMDLGAVICLPNGQPLCEQCPWKEICRAHLDGCETRYPVMADKKKRKKENRTIFLIYSGDKVLIRRRPEKGLLAGLYEFPNTLGQLNEESAKTFLLNLGLPKEQITEPMKALLPAKHVFSHIEWYMTGFAVRADFSGGLPDTLMAVSGADLETKYSIPSAFKAYREQLQFLWDPQMQSAP